MTRDTNNNEASVNTYLRPSSFVFTTIKIYYVIIHDNTIQYNDATGGCSHLISIIVHTSFIHILISTMRSNVIVVGAWKILTSLEHYRFKRNRQILSFPQHR